MLSTKNFDLSLIARTYINQHFRKLQQKGQEISYLGQSLLAEEQSGLRVLGGKITGRARLLLYGHQRDLSQHKAAILSKTKDHLEEHYNRLAAYQAQLKLISPERLLQRGFALVKQGGKILSHASQLKEGNKIAIILADREISATVNENKKYDGREFNL